jgi:anti-sigma regulatory factor (Ser/Thr protein kinase)
MEITSRLVPIQEPTHVAQARRCAAELTDALGFDDVASGRVAIAITEAATNLIKHAGGGELFIGITGAGPLRGLQLVAMDRGHGIRSLDVSLRDGYSTAGTAGNGLGAIRRSATTFDVYTTGEGTVLGATFFPAETPPLLLGAVSVPIPGETQNGDAWAAWIAGELTSIVVIDGLGHGPEAARAAAAGVEAFLRHAERSAEEVVGHVHAALRSTRGAAVALAEMDRRAGTLRYCGLGNISGLIVSPQGSTVQRLVSLSGIAGHIMRRVQQFTYPWPSGSMLVMHSDGIGTHWSLDKYPGLVARRPDVVAGVLYRDCRRGRDDATVVVTVNGGVA